MCVCVCVCVCVCTVCVLFLSFSEHIVAFFHFFFFVFSCMFLPHTVPDLKAGHDPNSPSASPNSPPPPAVYGHSDYLPFSKVLFSNWEVSERAAAVCTSVELRCVCFLHFTVLHSGIVHPLQGVAHHQYFTQALSIHCRV